MACRKNKMATGGRMRRPKPVAAKAGVSKNPKRRYGCGGKLK